MGFGGGAMIGSPLAQNLMDYYKTATKMGVVRLVTRDGRRWLVFMMFGAPRSSASPSGYAPAGYAPPTAPKKLVTGASVSADRALRTPQFWLLWAVLCLNVTAGIGVLSQASPMIQEMFLGG